MGLLRIRVRRGMNLISRDTTGSDPFVVVTMADQVLLLSLSLLPVFFLLSMYVTLFPLCLCNNFIGMFVSQVCLICDTCTLVLILINSIKYILIYSLFIIVSF